MTTVVDQAPSRLTPADMARAAGIGLRTRRLRSILSALGIMIGIGAMVAVLGLSESSKSDLLSQLDALGTNMLQVQATSGSTRTTSYPTPRRVDSALWWQIRIFSKHFREPWRTVYSWTRRHLTFP